MKVDANESAYIKGVQLKHVMFLYVIIVAYHREENSAFKASAAYGSFILEAYSIAFNFTSSWQLLLSVGKESNIRVGGH